MSTSGRKQSRNFECPVCREPQSSKVVSSVLAHPDDQWPFATEMAFIQCSKCQSALVQWREDWGEGFDADQPTFLYPAPKRLSLDIPRKLRAGFEEARTCFEAKAYNATAGMVRRTLEGTCADQGVKKKTLDASIKQLRTEGKIDGTLADWADMLRVVGNQGVHFNGESTSREDAQDALDFVEALLDHIYVLRKRFDAFKARRDDETKES